MGKPKGGPPRPSLVLQHPHIICEFLAKTYHLYGVNKMEKLKCKMVSGGRVWVWGEGRGSMECWQCCCVRPSFSSSLQNARVCCLSADLREL